MRIWLRSDSFLSSAMLDVSSMGCRPLSGALRQVLVCGRLVESHHPIEQLLATIERDEHFVAYNYSPTARAKVRSSQMARTRCVFLRRSTTLKRRLLPPSVGYVLEDSPSFHGNLPAVIWTDEMNASASTAPSSFHAMMHKPWL